MSKSLVIERTAISTAILIALGSLLALGIVDQSRPQNGENPPTMIFVSFLILAAGLDVIVPATGNIVVFTLVYSVVIWFQCCYLAMLISSTIRDLAIDRGLGWFIVVLCSVLLHALLVPVRKASGTSKLLFLRSYQTWHTILGCLFEICRYSTVNMTAFVRYYGEIRLSASQHSLVLGLCMAHVATVVVLGLVFVAETISSMVSDEEEAEKCDIEAKLGGIEKSPVCDIEKSLLSEKRQTVTPLPSDSESSSYWSWLMILPFVTVSLFHCYKTEMAAAFLR